MSDVAARWARLLPGVVDGSQLAELIGYGPATPRRPGEPRGRDVSRDPDEPGRRRTGPPRPVDYRLGTSGQAARTALAAALVGMRAAHQWLGVALERSGLIAYRPVEPGSSASVEIAVTAAQLPDLLAAVAWLAAEWPSGGLTRDVARADLCVIRADSDLNRALEGLPPLPTPPARRCSTPGCPNQVPPLQAQPAKKRKARKRREAGPKCSTCRSWESRHDGQPRQPSGVEEALAAQQRRLARGERWGDDALPRASSARHA